MKRFLSNFFCNFFLITSVFSLLILFYSETKSESKVLESVNALHESLIKISNKKIKSKNLALMDDVVKNLRRFNKINDLDFEHQSVRVIEDKFRLAGVILIADNERIKIDYLLGFKNDRWKIFDVLLDGSISEIATKKSDFKKIINEEGLSGLIKNLRVRNQL